MTIMQCLVRGGSESDGVTVRKEEHYRCMEVKWWIEGMCVHTGRS